VKVEFLHAAEEDLAEAAAYYDLRVSGLGREFLLEVERVAAVVLELPALGEQLDPVHRRVPLRRFPYGLVFRREGDVIRVVAVAHNRRRARYWTLRVQDR
jgi:plasmid stabilization system protein ParE